MARDGGGGVRVIVWKGPGVANEGAHLRTEVHEGDVLAGKYRVEHVLGEGGMGVVVAARHLQLNTKVALKFLLPSLLVNKEAVARFAREARAAVQITSEHVARVFDVGILETGAPFMVMEYLEGGDLGSWLEHRGILPTDLAIDFILQACVALAEAHALGIVHRDLKPSNLYCIRRPDGQLFIKVLDFGISKMVDGGASGMSVTKTSALMGSPLYMSPEQMESAKDVDARTDIWALGIVLFQLLTARLPFEGDTLPEILIKVTSRRPSRLREQRPDTPPGLEGVVAKCLEKDRRNRYGNVGQLAVALSEFAPRRASPLVDKIVRIVDSAGVTSGLPPPPTSAPKNDSGPSETIAPFGKTAFRTIVGKKMAVWIAGVVGATGITTMSLLLWGRGAPAPAAMPASAVLPRAVAVEQLADRGEPSSSAARTPAPSEPPERAVMATATAVDAGPRRSGATLVRAPRDPGGARPATGRVVKDTSCDPPFSIDAEGNQVFKRECVK